MQHDIEIEVRYAETDAQGVVHHANYFTYFELARVRFLAAMGFEYAELERQGAYLVVHSVSCRYIQPARFGDVVRVVTTIERVIPCVNAQGQIQRIPEFIFNLKLPE